MLTLPSRSQPSEGSLVWFSKGATRNDRRASIPFGSPAPPRASRMPTGIAAISSVATATAARRRVRRRDAAAATRAGGAAVSSPASAAANSRAFCQRLAGSFSRARSTACAAAAGVLFALSASGIGFSVICLVMIDTALVPENADSPENIS